MDLHQAVLVPDQHHDEEIEDSQDNETEGVRLGIAVELVADESPTILTIHLASISKLFANRGPWQGATPLPVLMVPGSTFAKAGIISKPGNPYCSAKLRP